MEAYVFNSDGTHEKIKPEKDEDGFSLQRLQKFVGGYIEVIKVGPCGVCENDTTMVMIVNEEGRLHNLHKNYVASGIAKMDIVGTAIYCPGEWLK
jgi:hypothetical protein